MKKQNLKLSLLTILLLVCALLFAHQTSAQRTQQNWRLEIPKTWLDAKREELEVPSAEAALEICCNESRSSAKAKAAVSRLHSITSGLTRELSSANPPQPKK